MITTLTVLLIASILTIVVLLSYDSPLFRAMPEEAAQVTAANHRSAEEQATRDLIGDEKYEAMSHHVSELLKRHANDNFKTVMLTSGSIDRTALSTLHSLLPGDSVRLQDNTRHGIPDVGVYVGEERIGRLLLDDATEALEAITGTMVTGAYVAEQNSYGDESDSISVKLIIFFTSARVPAEVKDGSSRTPYKVVYRGLRPIVIYQN